MNQLGNFCAGKKELTQRWGAEEIRRRCGDFNLYQSLGWGGGGVGVRSASILTRRNVNDLFQMLNSFPESATRQLTMNKMWGVANVQFKKSIEQNTDGETEIQFYKSNYGSCVKS